jgi:hypothetical protein
MRSLLPAIAFLVLSTGTAQAQYFRHMGWEDSVPGDQVVEPNCSALPDQSKLIISFTAPPGVSNLESVWGYIDFCTKPYALPSWWTFAPYGGCRGDALSASANFSSGPSTYADPWAGRGQASVQFEPSPIGDWGMARLEFQVQAIPGAPIPLQADKEYYASQIVFGNPDQGCDGCGLAACFVLNGLVIYHDGGIPYYTLMDYSNYCLWNVRYDCPFVVATEPTTWGRLKASYR